MRIRLIVFPAAHRLRGIREERDLRALHQWLGDMGMTYRRTPCVTGRRKARNTLTVRILTITGTRESEVHESSRGRR